MSHNLTLEILKRAVQRAGNEANGQPFDSHAVISVLLSPEFEKFYILALVEHFQTDDPIHYVNTELIGKQIEKTGIVKKLDETESLNMRGKISRNHSWQLL